MRENKLREKQETPDEGPRFGDYYVVVSEWGTWYVAPETAARIGRTLERRWRPRWMKFVDLSGSRVWVRTANVESITESTETQRSRDREFHFLRRKEENADRRWDDDE